MSRSGTTSGILDAPWVYRLSQSLTDPFRVVPLRRILARVPHASLLDLGCGTGELCAMTPAYYTGVDRSVSYITHARRHHGSPTRRFVTGDIMAPDPGLGHHDIAVLASVLHHLSDEEARRCLAGLGAVSPARILVVDVALEDAGAVFRRLVVPLDRGSHFRDTAALRGLLAESGWLVETEERYASLGGLFPYVALVAGKGGS